MEVAKFEGRKRLSKWKQWQKSKAFLYSDILILGRFEREKSEQLGIVFPFWKHCRMKSHFLNSQKITFVFESLQFSKVRQ